MSNKGLKHSLGSVYISEAIIARYSHRSFTVNQCGFQLVNRLTMWPRIKMSIVTHPFDPIDIVKGN